MLTLQFPEELVLGISCNPADAPVCFSTNKCLIFARRIVPKTVVDSRSHNQKESLTEEREI
jgi:hypothetical protein